MSLPPGSTPKIGETALVRRLVRAPVTSRDGETQLRSWLASIDDPAARDALETLCNDFPIVGEVLAGIAEGSPYLWSLAGSDPTRLATLLASEPQAHLKTVLATTAAAVSASRDEGETMRLLRVMKQEAALLIALADIGGVWPVTEVTRALTSVADAATTAAARFVLSAAARVGHILPRDAAHPEVGSGYSVIAMGKMGAGELNYSSDIDLIIVFDPAAGIVPQGVEPMPFFVRLTQRLVRLLGSRTGDGYVFRTDLRLRPDPASTHVAISLPAALNYYESRGQNWERAAFIKARACAGDIAAGDAFLNDLTPFVWRKFFDYAALTDVHAMKQQIQAFKGHGDIAVEGHNVKLGRGGIREIEFFVQTQQLVVGGRHAGLRGRETLPMLASLAEGGWITPQACADMTAAYVFLREVEHRLQMMRDEQTHMLPREAEELAHFARFMGFADRDAFASVLVEHLSAVQAHYAKLFEDTAARIAQNRGLVFAPDHDDRETLDKLSDMGFRRPLEVSTRVRRWLAGAPPSLRGPFARAQFGEILPLLIEHLREAEKPDAAIVAMDHFLNGLTGGARLFSLFRQHPDLVAMLALLLGSAPRLTDTLARYPQVMDALVDPSFLGHLPEAESLIRQLNDGVAATSSFEDALDRVRAFSQERRFFIGARILTGTVSATQAGEAFANVADAVVTTLHRAVEDAFAATYGHIPGADSAVVAMGRLGGREMTAGSDLDLLVLYDFDPATPESDGARRLHAAPYHARLTQRLINALTTPTNGGRLYDVDMRLRPSGRAGPVAASFSSFENYQREEAWTWEHMALTRARVVSASPKFRARVECSIREVLCMRRDFVRIAGDVVAMRQMIAAERGEGDRWNLKDAAGGLIDLEFLAQYLQLVNAADAPDILDTTTERVLERASRLNMLTPDDAEILRPAARLYDNLTQVLRICLAGPFDANEAGRGLRSLLARAGDMPDFHALDAHLAETQARVRAVFTRLLTEPIEAQVRRLGSG